MVWSSSLHLVSFPHHLVYHALGTVYLKADINYDSLYQRVVLSKDITTKQVWVQHFISFTHGHYDVYIFAMEKRLLLHSDDNNLLLSPALNLEIEFSDKWQIISLIDSHDSQQENVCQYCCDLLCDFIFFKLLYCTWAQVSFTEYT